MLICDLLARAGKLVARYIQKSSVFILAMCLASTSLTADPLDDIIVFVSIALFNNICVAFGSPP